jgi:hypothetical protein
VRDVSEIEQDIFEAVQGLSLAAAGLWLKMRYYIERLSDRPGHLQRDGRRMSGSELAIRAGSPPDTVSLLLAELADAGLVAMSEKEAHIWSPKLVAVSHVRATRTNNTRKSRKNRDSRKESSQDNDLRGVTNGTCNRDVTPHDENPPPPSFSPPITPSYPSPTLHHPPPANGAEKPAAPPRDTPPAADPDDELDSRIRQFIGQHRMLTYSPKALTISRQIALSPAGWDGMVRALDDALAAGAAEPFTYARTIVASEQARDRIQAAPRDRKPQVVTREAPTSRRDDF